MREILFRCSSLGTLMTDPRSGSKDELSVGAKTAIRELAIQDIFSVEIEASSKEMEKGIEVEDESIALLNRVRGLSLTKNTERRSNGLITGECDLFDADRSRGHDLKSSWSVKTFPGWVIDCMNPIYEWQMRGYMMLWDADEWEVNYALVDTPERLLRHEPLQLHCVSHIPEHLRLTTWTLYRDEDKEKAIHTKVLAARRYYAELLGEFDRTHQERGYIDAPSRVIPTAKPAPAPVSRPQVALPELF